MAVDETLLKEVLEQIRPNLQADGGDMEYIGVTEDGVVKLELQGAWDTCCSIATATTSRTRLRSSSARTAAESAA